MKDSLIFYAFKWPPYPETPKPGTPETLAGVWFWDNRGRKCCQAFDFQRNCQTCCSDFFWFGGGARFQTRFQGGFRGGFIPNPPGERESAFDLILLRFLKVFGTPRPELLAGVRFWHHRGRRCRNCWQGHGSGATEAGNAGRGTVLGPAWPQTLAGARSWGYGFAHTHTDVSPGASQARKANWWVSQGPRQGQTHPPVCAGLRLDRKLGSKLQSCVFVSEHAFP